MTQATKTTDRPMDLVFEHGLPSAPDAERFVLGAAIVGQPLANITAALQAGDFSLEKHKRIFAAMVALESSGIGVDRLTVAQELQRRGQLESVDGFSYLVSLDEGMPRLENIDSYISIVQNKSILRRAFLAHHRAAQECLTATEPTRKILERAERSIAELATETHGATLRT